MQTRRDRCPTRAAVLFPAFRTAAAGVSTAVALLCVSGCAVLHSLPRDADGWTERIQQARMLPVGVSHTADTDADLAKQERQLAEAIARRLGAQVEWREGNAHKLLEDLAERRLPLVVAALPSDTPFAQKVGLSRPYRHKGPGGKDYCLAVAPGENRLLLLVDKEVAAAEKRPGSPQ